MKVSLQGAERRSNLLEDERVIVALLPRLRVGVDQLAGLVLLGRQDRQGLGLAELLDVGSLEAGRLRPDRPRLGPLAVWPEADIADDRLERMRVHVFGKLVVVERLGG